MVHVQVSLECTDDLALSTTIMLPCKLTNALQKGLEYEIVKGEGAIVFEGDDIKKINSALNKINQKNPAITNEDLDAIIVASEPKDAWYEDTALLNRICKNKFYFASAEEIAEFCKSSFIDLSGFDTEAIAAFYLLFSENVIPNGSGLDEETMKDYILSIETLLIYTPTLIDFNGLWFDYEEMGFRLYETILCIDDGLDADPYSQSYEKSMYIINMAT